MTDLVAFLSVTNRIKSILAVVFAVFLAGLLAGCDNSSDGGNNNNDNDDTNQNNPVDEQEIKMRIQTSVVDDEGFVLPGAVVSFETDTGGAYLTTDEQGLTEYTSTLRQDLTVGARADGYLSQVRPLSIPDNASRMRLDFVLKALSEADTKANAESGFNYTSADGTGVELSAGTLVTNAWSPVVGEISIRLGSLDFDDPLSRQAFPGAFTGEDEQSRSTKIAALAAGNFSFSQSDATLALSFGETTTVVLPLTVENRVSGQPLAVGQMVPLWSLNEDAGLWKQEGNGMVIEWEEAPTGLAVQGSVSHFSWWLAAEALNSVSASVLMACPETDTTCQSTGGGGQVDFEAAEDTGPWYAQRVHLPEASKDAMVTTELPTLPMWVYGFDTLGGYGGSHFIESAGGAYPPQIPLNPQADESIKISLQPLHELLSDWPEARGRSPLTGLLNSLHETHEYPLNLRPNDDLLLQVTRIDQLDFDPDTLGEGVGVDVVIKDPYGIVLFNETLDSGGPLSTTVPVDTGGEHSLSLTGWLCGQ